MRGAHQAAGIRAAARDCLPGQGEDTQGQRVPREQAAIVGVRVLAGRIRPGQGLIKEDGKSVGKIKSIQSEGKSLAEAISGAEVAISIDDATVGRQIDVEDVLLVDIPESHAHELLNQQLKHDELEVFEQHKAIKRKEKPFWGS